MLQGRDYKDPPEFVKAQRRSLFAWSDSPVHAQSSSSRDFRSGPLGSSEAGSSGGGRRLQSGGVVEDARQPRTGAGSLAEGLGDSVATGTQRKLAGIPQSGPEHGRSQWEMAQELRGEMQNNLNETGWLNGFEPMQMHCPLLGRRIEWNAVSEFAVLAWRCDGLGFSWECLHSGQRNLK